MAVTKTQSAQKQENGVASTTLAFPSNVTAGNYIYVGWSGFTTGGGSLGVPTDTLTHTYSGFTGQFTISTNVLARQAYVANISGGANSVTVAFSGGTGDLALVIAEFAGVDTSTPANGTAVTAANGTNTTPSTGNKTPSVDNCLLLAAVYHNGLDTTITEAGDWNLIEKIESGTSGMPISCIWKQQTTAAAEDANWTLGASRTHRCQIHAFEAAAVVPKSLIVPRRRNALIGR